MGRTECFISEVSLLDELPSFDQIYSKPRSFSKFTMTLALAIAFISYVNTGPRHIRMLVNTVEPL